MYCTKCGNKTQEQERYCTQCGNPISEDIRLSDFSISEDKELDQDECIEIKDTGINNRPDELTPPPIPNQIDSTTEILVGEENLDTIDNTKMWRAPFSFKGRIRRSEYVLSIIIHLVCIFIPIVNFISIWFILAQTVKRGHDVGNSAWWVVLSFLLPSILTFVGGDKGFHFLAIIFLFYPLILTFEEGDKGANEYGNNPKGIK